MPQKPAFPTAPKVNNTALEAKMAAFKTQRTAPNLAAILQQLPSSLLFLAMSPSSPEAIKALKETQPGKDLPDFVKKRPASRGVKNPETGRLSGGFYRSRPNSAKREPDHLVFAVWPMLSDGDGL